MQIRIVLMLFTLFLLFSCGCAKNYNKWDVKQYVKEKYELKNFKVGPQIKINSSDSYWVVTIEGEDGYEWYPDLCGDKGFEGVSFGTLFEIMKREGYEGVEGNLWHYSFTGVDGCVYEISYDFCNYLQAVSEEEVNAMTGLVLKYGRMEEESGGE